MRRQSHWVFRSPMARSRYMILEAYLPSLCCSAKEKGIGMPVTAIILTLFEAGHIQRDNCKRKDSAMSQKNPCLFYPFQKNMSARIYWLWTTYISLLCFWVFYSGIIWTVPFYIKLSVFFSSFSWIYRWGRWPISNVTTYKVISSCLGNGLAWRSRL